MSVIIPCFNYERYVAQAITSALDQSAVEVDVIVVDDASRDGSQAVVAAIAGRDPRVRLITHDTNAGPVTTFNDGLAEATGDYVVRLDADDMLTPGSLARSVALAETFPDVGLVYGRPRHFTGEVPPARITARRWTIWPGRRWLHDRARTGVNVITSPEAVMRRSVVDQVGGQRELAHTHDMEMWLRIACVSDVGYVEGPDQAWHREHDASLSQSMDRFTEDLEDRREAFEVLFDWARHRIPRAEELRQASINALATDALLRIRYLHDRSRWESAKAAALLTFAESLGPVDVDPALRRTIERVTAADDHGRPAPREFLRAAIDHGQNRLAQRRWRRRGVFDRASL